MKKFFIFILFFGLSGFLNSVYSQNIVLDSVILNNLEKNSSKQEVYDFANKIFSEKRVCISETQAEIDFKAKAIKEIFDLDIALPEREFKQLSYLIETDLYKDPAAKELLNYAGQVYTFNFPYYVLKKNPEVSLKDINNYVSKINFDTAITDEALTLIIQNNTLVLVDNVFSNERIRKISKLNDYALERLQYNNTIPIDDKSLKEFLEYAKLDSEKSKMVERALKQNDMQMYKTVLADIQTLKLEQAKALEEQKKKENREYCKKCFLSPNEHIHNFLQYDRRSNSAFAVGLLNPINLIATIIYLPVYVILSPFSGLH